MTVCGPATKSDSTLIHSLIDGHITMNRWFGWWITMSSMVWLMINSRSNHIATSWLITSYLMLNSWLIVDSEFIHGWWSISFPNGSIGNSSGQIMENCDSNWWWTSVDTRGTNMHWCPQQLTTLMGAPERTTPPTYTCHNPSKLITIQFMTDVKTKNWMTEVN